MPDDVPSPSERSDATRSRPPSSSAAPAAPRPPAEGVDPPTVRRGGSGSTSQNRGIGPADPPVPLPRPGERIDAFELAEPIGVGGMGAVFRALDSRLDRPVALKILPPEQAGDPEVVQRFYQEGRAAARLDHENIARVFTIGHDGRYHFIAFEYIEGTTLRQRVERNGPLPVGDAINFTLQIADALVHASERGVVHRDIKPSNIVVTPAGRAKLVDMGLARRFERGGDDGLTQSGMTLGTFDYISPEQARDPRDVDVRSDLYSLGCTLFHMLTGRPPFPEGTVLQKLIQHQEEAPPDVRALNPAVPPDLAGVLVKLMAKDRDRRYQTPEQLVRDLLTLAGSLGLRSVSPEGLVWLSSGGPAAWERHLAWGVPALMFAVIVAALFWWGQDPAATVASTPAPVAGPKLTVRPSAAPAPGPEAPRAPAPRPAVGSPPAEVAAAETGRLAAETSARREIPVDPTDDLLSALASAPPRAVILLTEDGPYTVGNARTADVRVTRPDLTVRAAAGARPVIRPAAGGPARPAVLDFVGGRVTLDGIEFELPAGDRAETAAVRADETELTLTRCLVRRAGSAGSTSPSASPAAATGRPAAVLLRSAATSGDRPPVVVIDRCHLDGGQAGVVATGPVDLTLRDCTSAAAPAVWFVNPTGSAVPADLTARHLSLLADAGPVFRFEGSDVRARLEDSVVAPAADRPATLVATDRPEALAWRGRGNVYGRIATFLTATDPRPSGPPAVADAARWAGDGDDPRESGSRFLTGAVWDGTDPVRELAQDPPNPGRAFRLALRPTAAGVVGARQGPEGALAGPVGATAASALPRDVRNEPRAPEGRDDTLVASSTPRETGPAATQTAPRNPEAPTPAAPGETESTATTARLGNMGEMPEMPVMPPTGPGREKPGVAGDPAEGGTTPAAPEAPAAKPAATPPAKPDPEILRTAEQFSQAISDPAARGRLLRVAADADWEFPGLAVRAGGSWRIQAEPGATRPRLRFAPPVDPKGASAWSGLFDLRGGSLQIQGCDLVLPRAGAPREGRWAAVLAWPATDLGLTDCTVTVEGDDAPSAVVAVASGSDDDEPGVNAPSPQPTTVRFTDCLLRGGGDLIDVAAGRRLVLDLTNSVVATGGSLVHAHGLPRGQAPEKVNVTLRQVTSRTAGGLLLLESAPGEPDLPVTEVSASNSILATTPSGAPLVRVEGQDSLESVRKRVQWEGRGVAYHKVANYRRDQSAQVGTVPTLYDRQSWTVAVGANESTPVHGDMKFRRDWDPTRPAWSLRRDDVELGPDSPAGSAGPELSRVPDPPVAS